MLTSAVKLMLLLVVIVRQTLLSRTEFDDLQFLRRLQHLRGERAAADAGGERLQRFDDQWRHGAAEERGRGPDAVEGVDFCSSG